MAVAGVHVRSWQAAYRNILPDDYLNQLRPEDRAAVYDFATRDPLKPKTIVAVEEACEPGDPRIRNHHARDRFRHAGLW